MVRKAPSEKVILFSNIPTKKELEDALIMVSSKAYKALPKNRGIRTRRIKCDDKRFEQLISTLQRVTREKACTNFQPTKCMAFQVIKGAKINVRAVSIVRIYFLITGSVTIVYRKRLPRRKKLKAGALLILRASAAQATFSENSFVLGLQ